MSRGLFQEILSRTNPSSLELLGSEITKNNVPLAFDLLGLDFTLDSVCYFLKEVLDSMRWFKMEMTQNEAFYEFRLYNYYNIRWSFFLKSCLTTIFEFIHLEPAIDVSERVVKLRLSRKFLLNSNQRFEILNMN